MSERYVVVVDGYSAGNLLAPEFRARGVRCAHVQTTEEIWPILLPTFRPDDYDSHHVLRGGDVAALATQLRELDPIGVLPGTETGVELADQLATALALPTSNGTDKSAARRDKYLMGEAVRAKGLPVAQQLLSDDVAEVLAWADSNALSKVVVKPVKSAGTDGVAVCTTPEEVAAACTAILGTTNKLGLANGSVLAQEFLGGTEYFLNTVSRDGRHHVTDIWRYRKRSINGFDCVYDCNELLPHDGETSSALREYVLGVLDALEISHGPAHTEVMMTPNGPMLVESGARLDGLSVPSVNTACVGYGPVDLTVDAYADPAAYAAKTAAPYPLSKHALTVYLTSYEAGLVRSIPGEEPLRALRSFFQMRLRVKPGSKVGLTTNYFTAPGFLTLVHESKEQLMADYETVRGWERQGRIFDTKE